MKRIAPALLVAAMLAAAPAIAHIDVPGLDVNGQCVGDADSDAVVKINELIIAVNNALGACARLPITLNFRGVVGDKAFACGIYDGIGTGASQFIPVDFRFYVSNIRLVTAAGSEVPLELDQDYPAGCRAPGAPVSCWQYQNVAMIDFETGPDNGCSSEGNAAVNTVVKGSVPAGIYTGLEFDLGLPFDLNHANASTALSPLNFTAMFWNWNAGYKFLRVDTGDDKFRVHLGSIGCDGGSPSRPPTTCSRPNLPTVHLSGFNPSHSVIEADLAALLADNNLDVNQPPESAPGCQSDPDDQDCIPVFRNLGLNFADGSPSPATQRFFRFAAEDHEQEHVEIKVASSTDGGGALVAHPEFDIATPIRLPFDECFGGTGAECEGGMRLFSGANPGIEPLDESEPDESVYALAAGTTITLEVTQLDAGLTFNFGGTTLDHVGAMVLLGQAPDFHADLEAQIVLPGGQEPSGTFSAGFKLTTTSSQYQSSESITVKFTPVDE